MTSADCERFRRWLVGTKGLAPSTVAKHIQRCRTMFHELVRDKILTENPFSSVKATSKVNRDRDYFVAQETAQDVLDACHNHDWRVVFGLARYAGFRPCEILTLKWSEINWDTSKIHVNSPKTGSRFHPLWPGLRTILWDAHVAAPDHSVRCVPKYGPGANLGTELHRIIERAGHEVWPKTFVNLRATRRTELERHIPHHVVNSWMGHGSKVAAAHYLQVTDADWQAAESFTDKIGGDTGGDICAPIPSSPTLTAATMTALAKWLHLYRYPLPDSNEGFRTESPTSWAARRRGPLISCRNENLLVL